MRFGSRRILAWLACALLALGLCVPAFAQAAPEGRIAGIVKDASGAVIPGAAVVVTNDKTNATHNTTSSAEGTFVVPSIAAGSYTVKITAKGFATAVYKQVMVEVGKEYSLTAALGVGGASEVVEVVAGQELVNTTSSDVTATLTTPQVSNLPLNGRDIISLISTQAGVTYNGRTSTVINGNRPSWSQVTLDGVNIQDLYIRTNALDYIPNRPTTDTVQEFSINTSGQGADAALGSTGVRMVTPSGANDYHGGVWLYNNQNGLSANSDYNNHYGIEKPFYLRNEFGGKLGGHIIKNKLFFYGYYVGIRERTSYTGTRYIPLNDDYKTGVFRYAGGPAAGVNLFSLFNPSLTAAGLPTLGVDPLVKSAFLDKIDSASTLPANPVTGDSYNYAGVPIPQLNNYPRDNYGTKIDYNPTENNHFDFTYSYLHEMFWRPDIDPYNTTPGVTNDSKVKLYTGAWRYNISNHLINNVRFGLNDAPAPFIVSSSIEAQQQEQGFFFASTANLTSPLVTFMRQGRYPKIYQVLDDATYAKGNHQLSFGGQFQRQFIPPYNAAGIIPTITTGLPTTTTAPSVMRTGLTTAMFTDAGYGAPSSSDLSRANSLLMFLSGIITSESQTFNVKDTTSGYVAGQQQQRHLRLNDFSFYGQDKWRLKSNLTVTFGAKWEYLSPYTEENGLQLGPLYGNDPRASILDPNTQVGFLKQMYNKQYTNIGPTLGFAWDPFKNGKTSIRGGYTLTFVNDDVLRVAGNAIDNNYGLSSSVTLSGLYSNFSGTAPGGTTSGIIPITPPTFTMPRTLSNQLAISLGAAVYGVDPNVRLPKVHEINFGIERELPKDIGVSVRYVGTLGRGLLRAVDLNQNKGGADQAFVDDFIRARTNAYLSQAAGLGFKPQYNSAVTGSQPLTVLTAANLGADPWLFLGSVTSYLQQNRVADLADFYAYYRTYFPGGPTMFLPNPGIYVADYASNLAYSSYHGMQAEARRRFKSGLQFQANYTWSKLLSDTPTGGSSQTRLDPFLDNARPWLNKSRANFDLRHALKGNVIYELPFGHGKWLLGGASGPLNKIVGGWQLSSIAYWQSGNPFSITDSRGTFNRSGRSGIQSPISNLTAAEIKNLFGFWEDPATGNRYYINPQFINVKSSTNPTGNGQAIAPDSQKQIASSAFAQIFFHPGPGQIGNIRPLEFEGPANMNVDMGLAKSTKVTERINTLFRVDAFNVLNHPVFYVGDQSVTSSSFGQIFYTNNNARVIQLSMRIEF